jgi:hypothetical protein
MQWPFSRLSRSSRLLAAARLAGAARPLLGAAALAGGTLLLLGTLGSPALPAEPGRFALVASPEVPVSEVSFDEVTRLFSFHKKFWKPGEPASVLLPASGLEARKFLLKKVYKLSEPELRQMILKKLYQGEIDLPPKVASTDREALSFVASARGLVTIVPADSVRGTNVKVLRVDGKLPSDAGYILK